MSFDIYTLRRMFISSLFLTVSLSITAQSDTCDGAEQMCPDQGATTYPAGTSGNSPHPGNNYGCLGTQPNPAWFYLHVGSSGGGIINLTNSNNLDIDFAMWGPFPDLSTALSNCGSLPGPTDCSFSGAANETVNFPSANPGDIFLLLITNFSQQPTNITASDPAWPNSTFSCDPPGCEANAGNISSPQISECFGSSNLLLSLPPSYSGPAPDPSSYDYTYLISDAGGTILFDDPGPNLTSTPAGTYQVCGLSYDIVDAGQIPGLVGQNVATVDADLSSSTPPFCGDITDFCVDVVINPPIPPTDLPDEFICPGECIPAPDGSSICAPGAYSYTFVVNGCDSIVNLTVIEKTLPESFVTFDVCEGGCVTVAGQQVCAPGSQQVVLSSAGANGCDSIINVDFNEIIADAVIFADPPEISCGNPIVVLDGSGSSPGAIFEWFDGSGSSLGNASSINVTQSGNYTLSVSVTENGVTCMDDESVFIDGNTWPPLISTTDLPEACSGADFDLRTINISDINGLNPFITFHNDSPVDFSNEIDPVINILTTTTYYIRAEANGCVEEIPITVTLKPVAEFEILDSPTVCEGEDFDLTTLNINFYTTPDAVTYHDGSPAGPWNEIPSTYQFYSSDYVTVATSLDGCIFEQQVYIEVFPTPGAFFDADKYEVCLTDSIWVDFADFTIDDPQFFWDFDGGFAFPGTDEGPHIVKFDEPRFYEFSLWVEDNGCISNTEYLIIEVADTLELPVISCQTGKDSILFEWNDVGASNNDIQILTGQTAASTTATSLVVNGLSLGEEVTVLLTAGNGGGCPDQVVQATCITDDCPVYTITIVPPDTICLDASAVPFQLSGTVAGGTGNGIAYWSGVGITDSVTGAFDPHIAGSGLKTVFYNYEENGCRQSERATVVIHPQPTADFSLSPSTCMGDTVQINYLGTPLSADSTIVFNWSLDGGQQVADTFLREEFVYWDTPGIKNLELHVERQGCPSEPFTRSIIIDSVLAPPVINCRSFTDSLAFLWQTQTDVSDFTVLVDGNIVQNSANPLFTVGGLSVGDSVEITVIANSSSNCPNVSSIQTCITNECPDFNIQLQPVTPICLDGGITEVSLSATVGGGAGGGVFAWSGAGVDPGQDVFRPFDAGAGVHQVEYMYTEGNCVESVFLDIEVNSQPTADFSLTSPICLTENAVIEYLGTGSSGADFQYDFGTGINAGNNEVNWNTPGIYPIELIVTENGCISTPVIQNAEVHDTLESPVISCQESLNDIVFEWDGVTNSNGYEILINGNQQGSQNAESFAVGGLLPGGDQVEITVVAISDNACPNVQASKTCQTRDCPGFLIDIEQPDTICFNEVNPLQLLVTVSGNDGTGTGLWSGAGVSSDGIFDANAVGAGLWTVTYDFTENNCNASESVDILVQAEPEPGFTIIPEVCVGELADLQFLTPPSANAEIIYDFSFSQNDLDAGATSDEIKWTEGGDKMISVTVREGQCISSADEQVTVFDELIPPVVACRSEETSVEFFWSDVMSATDYQALIVSAPTYAIANQPDDFTYSFDNLNPRDSVTITVTVSQAGSPCPPVEITQTCQADPCPNIELVFNDIQNTCLVPGFSEQLTVDILGGSQNGTLTWSGDFVNSDGVFEPTAAGVFQIAYNYVWRDCQYFGSTEIEIFETPVASFDYDTPICLDSVLSLEYTGTQLSGLQFDWMVENAVGSGSFGSNPEVSFTQSGLSNITLQVEANGCFSNIAEGVIQVDEPLNLPVIECDTDETSITFSWNNDAQVSDYQIEVLTGQSGDLTGNVFMIENLLPDTDVQIELTATGSTVCGSVKVSADCTTKPCPQVDFETEPVPSICLTDDASAINLFDFIKTDYQNLSETWAWSGLGVSDQGVFDPIVAGVGKHDIEVVYEVFSVCTYRQIITIEVNDLPVSDASAEETVLDCAFTPLTIGGAGNSGNAPTVVYEWTGGNFLQTDNSTAVVNEAGTYILRAFDPSTGCSSSDEIIITLIDDRPDLGLLLSDITCFGYDNGRIWVDTVIGGTGPYLYSFNGSPFGSTEAFNNLSPGNFTMTVQDVNFCTDTESLSIVEPEELNVELQVYVDGVRIEDGETVDLGDEVEVDAVGTFSADRKINSFWAASDSTEVCPDDECTEIFFSPNHTVELSIRIEDENGCTASDAALVRVDRSAHVYIPSGFSPRDENGVNDVFRLYAKPNNVEKVKFLRIFDRWGSVVFENTNFDIYDDTHGWDGRFRGNLLNSGVFVFVAEIVLTDGRTEIFKGDVTLK